MSKNYILAVLALSLSAIAYSQSEVEYAPFTFEYDLLPEANMDYTETIDTGNYSFGDYLSETRFYGRKETWGGYSGFTYSNVQDSVTAGPENDRAAFPAIGANGTPQYGICFGSNYGVFIDSPIPLRPTYYARIFGMYITNATYAVRSMESGDAFAKKFGGEDGTDPDWFLLKIKGYAWGDLVDSAEIYLADFRSDDPAEDYIVKDWRYVSLIGEMELDSLSFELSSSDTGMFGMNTPAYFCIDEMDKEVYPNSLENRNTLNDVLVFPNPAHDYLYIKNDQNRKLNITIADISGKVVSRLPASSTINISALPAGVYMLHLAEESSGKERWFKFVKN